MLIAVVCVGVVSILSYWSDLIPTLLDFDEWANLIMLLHFFCLLDYIRLALHRHWLVFLMIALSRVAVKHIHHNQAFLVSVVKGLVFQTMCIGLGLFRSFIVSGHVRRGAEKARELLRHTRIAVLEIQVVLQLNY